MPQQSYSYSVYLNLPTAAWFYIQCWKHRYPGEVVLWDGGMKLDVMSALGGAANIQAVSQPYYRSTELPHGCFRKGFQMLKGVSLGRANAAWWACGRPATPPRALEDTQATPVPQQATTVVIPAACPPGKAATVAVPPRKAPPQPKPPCKAPPPHRPACRRCNTFESDCPIWAESRFPALPPAVRPTGQVPVKAGPVKAAPVKAAPPFRLTQTEVERK